MPRLLLTSTILLALVILLGRQREESSLGRAENPATGGTLLVWNDLGMHCLDSDFAVFSILPPFNTIEAQFIDSEGLLLLAADGIELSYRAVADPEGSENRSSVGKSNFWQYAQALYGATPLPDEGLAGHEMPGAMNTPRAMSFDPAAKIWRAAGIPITPYDDLGRKRYYPLMRVEARLQSGGQLLASADVVLPVSDELDCRACHASGAHPDAAPAAGWVWQANAEYDYRGNILRLHDEKQAGDPDFAAALAARGYSAAGLLDTVVNQGTPILCAGCHASNALPGTGLAGISPLTSAMHAKHAAVVDPANGLTLDAATNRGACYRCHPGSDTRCLRGAMGSAVAADGSLAIQCQNCHGSMSEVGDPNRDGWLDLPSCGNCHSGNAVQNGGQIRFTAAHLANGNLRQPAHPIFATQPNVPAPGYSLYRFSTGHGGLRCEACHGSTHAEYPGLHGNDNLQAIDLQGHVGTVVECQSCHPQDPQTRDGGPHGMHPVGQNWVIDHKPLVYGGNYGDCRNCHGGTFTGTELSRAQADRILQTPWGPKTFLRGMQISCFECHDGPDTPQQSPNLRPVAQPIAASYAGAPLAIQLLGSDPENAPLSYRIVAQPKGGTVALAGATATYVALPGFAGTDRFRYLVRDGVLDSLPVEVTITRGASAQLVRTGYPGTNGAPGIAVAQAPVLGTSFDLLIGNSWGTPTQALVVHSFEAQARPTPFGGTLWVRPDAIDLLGLGATGATVPIVLPNDPALEGRTLHLQVAQYDPGATFGVAFSAMLDLSLGY